MNRVDWPEDFETVVRSHLPDPPPAGELDPNFDLVAAGMDSLETIGLMTELERIFDFEFPDDLLKNDTFSTPGILWRAVSSCLRPT